MKLKVSMPVLLLGLILLSTNSFSQNNRVDIQLIVNVDDIEPGNLETTCEFEGQPQGVSLEDFTNEVANGDIVKWTIKVSDGSAGNAKLEKFKHETGKKLFLKDSIPASLGRIRAKVEDGSPGDEEKYSLEFRIKKQGTSDWIYYQIDPKLLINR